jgi:mannose-1-phosphate guanylyltransferase/mannose-1-phosphate guanylyltransferase/mannose-6-phosphate isomerase
VAAAALIAVESDPEAMLLVVPSDHLIGDVPAFLQLVETAVPAARDGSLITFAVVPTRPETGYGYIRQGAALTGHPEVFAVEAFTEKPDTATARQFIESGRYFWNSGMFLFSAKSFLAELGLHAPAVLDAVAKSVVERSVDLDFLRLNAEHFAASPSISIDYAVMEKTANAATIPCDVGWTDVGAWSELWNVGDKDVAGNVLCGDVVVEDSQDCYVRSESLLTAVVGLKDLVVISTDDAVLVANRGKSQQVKLIVDRLRRDGRGEAKVHTRVYRPWGYSQRLHGGDRFQVNRLTVVPGGQLSLHKHYHRAEHWVVVNGTALITCDGASRIVRENEAVDVPLGAVHRLENPGKVPLNIIEVQSGSYLADDDIVRLEDSYGRS